MSWLKRIFGRPVRNIQVQDIRFVGEQDGVPERELKAEFLSVLNAAGIVVRAYLAKVAYGPSGVTNVALCLRTQAQPDMRLLQALSRVFADMFNTKEHLDIMVLDDGKEAKVSVVCRAFFVRGPAAGTR